MIRIQILRIQTFNIQLTASICFTMIKAIVVILFIFGGKSLAKPRNEPDDCPTLIHSFDAGIPASLGTSFARMVAHGVHSLTIQDINYYFPNNKVGKIIIMNYKL